ncbi:MAG: DNA-processing protein DprA [Candidatus Margulisbacteria bacterium]|nr:DNA-processing protein DprA [Candidatus Margulisiibacteriota bacterium]
MMNKDLKYWLAINKIPNVGPVTIKKLWQHFGSVEPVWKADEKDLAKIEGISKSAIKSFLKNRNQIDLNMELEAIKRAGIKVLTLEDEEYPNALKNIYDPPAVLYFKGKGFDQNEKVLAIVGTRRASRYGKEMAKKLAYELASLGIVVVSGMALGVDTLAHEGVLEAKGKTIAVFGCGVDVIYPPSNRDLARKIESSGAIVSEFPLGTGIERGHFPRRNRVIAGLALGTIVVEGHYDSGAMITAKYALEEGREVFAVPGNVEIDQSKGPHWLIKQGAKLIETVDDILEELPMIRAKRISDSKSKKCRQVRDYSDLPEEEQKIVKVLSLEPKYIDNISFESGLPIPQVSSLLMMLEVKKIIRQLPGKMFVLY